MIDDDDSFDRIDRVRDQIRSEKSSHLEQDEVATTTAGAGSQPASKQKELRSKLLLLLAPIDCEPEPPSLNSTQIHAKRALHQASVSLSHSNLKLSCHKSTGSTAI